MPSKVYEGGKLTLSVGGVPIQSVPDAFVSFDTSKEYSVSFVATKISDYRWKKALWKKYRKQSAMNWTRYRRKLRNRRSKGKI